jgi:S-adenosylmethionine-diacylglycerol 3-amino-3-carboxypropyl transferase
MFVTEWLSGRIFQFVHGRNLVFNTCWEDPRLDRRALQMGPDDRVLVITSAGCNALDYALTGVGRIYAVDLNPRQNALLELKLAGIRQMDFDDFFAMFGDGHLRNVREVYKHALRYQLSPWSRRYWDRWIRLFEDSWRPFYYRGTAGTFARFLRTYGERVLRVRPLLEELLEVRTLDEQRRIYYEKLRPRLWTPLMRFAMNRDTTLSLIGVPPAQRRQIETQYQGGIVKFVENCVDAVFGHLPLWENYFWRVYMTGQYSRDCCPEYLREANFRLLKDSLADRITVHTNSVQGFLEQHQGNISRFVLLDHMDWLSDRFFPLLEAEWQAIVNRASPEARIIWRSGGLRTDFMDRVRVRVDGREHSVTDLLSYERELADELHDKDRVHTYASFHIAKVAA